ncbi:MAG: hypothetical protein ACI30L_04125 [Muribaculaceae bacterium]
MPAIAAIDHRCLAVALHNRRKHTANASDAKPIAALNTKATACPTTPQTITPATNGKSNLSNGTRDNAEW